MQEPKASRPEARPAKGGGDNLFFAIFPAPAAAAQAAATAQRLRAEQGLAGRPLRTERFHVTLYHVGNYARLPEDVVSAARDAASTVAMPPFEVVFDRAESFPIPRHSPLVLVEMQGGKELQALWQTLSSAMKKTGLRSPAASRFNPHLTLLYDERRIAEQSIEPIHWSVNDFVLVHSLVGKSRYVERGRWTLGR